ncbi:alpha/beta fold hydrolase [Georgenia sp. SYP-B2076]|uniref:alpha/beta fold hydrolase n=1 Tax=Georgenia sp. SYP-B2076 TaxID=2495881 RepID=UPI000F8E5C44|nr:alpha/beta fold hydrolase [Georgenia sp. SYP-B2076]
MATYLLIHGAFYGAWSWESTQAALRARGHRAEAVDLPGSGADDSPAEEVTLDAYVERVRQALAALPQPVTLVGHSMGGVVITQVAARYPELVSSLIYVAAFLPGHGQSLVAMTELPEGADDGVQRSMVVAGEPPVASLSAADARAIFMGECPAGLVAQALPLIGTQALAPFLTPVELPDGGVPVRRDYVLSALDRAIPPALQRRMATEGGATTVIELAADHSPFYSCPDELVDALEELAGP